MTFWKEKYMEDHHKLGFDLYKAIQSYRTQNLAR